MPVIAIARHEFGRRLLPVGGNPLALEARDHAVSFYADEAELSSTVAAFLAGGLAAGESVSMLVTPEHGSALTHAIADLGIDRRVLSDPDRFRVFDAAGILEELMVDGDLVPEQFHARLTTFLGPGRPRVFGEMVALLWAAGDVAAAIRLEELWNEAAELAPFSLLCSYPTSVLGQFSGVAEVSRVCATHNHVSGPGSYTEPPRLTPGRGPSRSDVYLPVPEAVAAARGFVADALQHAHVDLLVDAGLVTSEIVTNAVLHGLSAFRVHVHTAADRVRITVEDAVPGAVVPRLADPDALDGRGLVIVEALSTQWGCEVSTEGKAVWAELAADRN